VHQIQFRLGLHPEHRWGLGAYSVTPADEGGWLTLPRTRLPLSALRASILVISGACYYGNTIKSISQSLSVNHFVVTRCQIFPLKCTKFNFGLGFTLNIGGDWELTVLPQLMRGLANPPKNPTPAFGPSGLDTSPFWGKTT